MLAEIIWPSGVSLSVVSASNGAQATVSGQTPGGSRLTLRQASVPVGGQVNVVISVSPTAKGIYRPIATVTPSWALAANPPLTSIHTPRAGSGNSVYLPLVMQQRQ